ncbi:hypothetical protein EDD90_3282 [Streptomyces sp. Ag109_O5-1]|uniref:hypothetical protein n=1 Tax=Streptomyces sp. Ag109_O5-1 TaxID=1938851 RepID=UPI000F4ECD0B|nr:hypothetical protein [Streptomyces sp. Ag109_O5-1]RPE40246.1 hypothetical protein EDD90_3282 [Streptomyces sp. Ag109_O5-1]
MGLLDRLFGDDHQRAATKYEGRESATDRAARQRRQSHRRTGAQRAAQQGQAWEDRDRKRRGTSFWTW